MGTPKYDGIIIKDAEGREWKAFKWILKNDNTEQIEIDMMCAPTAARGEAAFDRRFKTNTKPHKII